MGKFVALEPRRGGRQNAAVAVADPTFVGLDRTRQRPGNRIRTDSLAPQREARLSLRRRAMVRTNGQTIGPGSDGDSARSTQNHQQRYPTPLLFSSSQKPHARLTQQSQHELYPAIWRDDRGDGEAKAASCKFRIKLFTDTFHPISYKKSEAGSVRYKGTDPGLFPNDVDGLPLYKRGLLLRRRAVFRMETLGFPLLPPLSISQFPWSVHRSGH